jgi:hypothetical protein
MEEYIKNISYSLIIISLFKSLIPENTYKKTVSVIIGLMLFTIVLKPFEIIFSNNNYMDRLFEKMEENVEWKFENDSCRTDDINNKISEFEEMINERINENETSFKEEGQ